MTADIDLTAESLHNLVFPIDWDGLRAAATEVNAWVVIHTDDRVLVRIARSEMGQGTYTALAQLVAEELDCDWANVTAEFASPNEHVRRNRVWGSMSTGGSQGVRGSHDYVRKAGAAAREMLVAAAAAQWKVPAGECRTEAGQVIHKSGKKLGYGALTAPAAQLPVPATPAGAQGQSAAQDFSVALSEGGDKSGAQRQSG